MKNSSLPASPAQTPEQSSAPVSSAAASVTRSFRTPRGLFSIAAITLVALLLTACAQNFYKFPQYNYAGRPVPPSKLAERVMVSLTLNGSAGGLQILDGLRDIRNNLENTIPGFSVNGYNGAYPSRIYSFPEQLRGYVYSSVAPFSFSLIDYGTETAIGSAGTLPTLAPSIAIGPDFIRIFAAEEQQGQLVVLDNSNGQAYSLNLPNVYRVAVNRGDTVALAMVRNSNALYRVVKLNSNTTAPPGAIDCQPTVLPVYCVLPVPGSFDRPQDVVFAVDGTNAYVLNCGVECGGGTNGGAGVSIIPQGALQINTLPTALPYPAVVTSTTPVPGGVTTAISDGITLYLAGQQMQPSGLFAGRLTTMNLTTLATTAPVSISDGSHNKLLFADDNTLWIGSQFCATGERARLGLNYNCLTRYNLTNQTAQIVPAVTGGSVPYPNADNNLVYLGSLTGICWVQNYHKVYTAYGGQVHAFSTVDGSEINNYNITVQGTALDVTYMDALTNSAN